MNIIIIYGCGGDRDKIKRPQIAKVVSKYTNLQIITDDNPRNESSKKIRKEIIKGAKGSKAKEISGRKKAIIHALKNSDPYEIILIAGKGHETYQDLGKRKIFLSDKKIIRNLK